MVLDQFNAFVWQIFLSGFNSLYDAALMNAWKLYLLAVFEGVFSIAVRF